MKTVAKTLVGNKACQIRYNGGGSRRLVVKEGGSVLMELPRERALALAHKIIEVMR